MATATPLPMQGRLPVEFDQGLGPIVKPLADVPVDVTVTVTATVVDGKPLPGARSMLVLGDAAGNTAVAYLDGQLLVRAARDKGSRIEFGEQVQLRGQAVRRVPSMPMVIDVRQLRAVA